MNLIKPSFSTGYAKNASESANPNLWKGLVGAWMPSFGVTGETLKDVSGNGNDGALEHDTSWKTNNSQRSLYFDGVQDHVSGLGDISVSADKPFTITARIKLLSFTDQYPFVYQIKTDTQYAYSLFVSNNSGYLGVNFGSANTWVRQKTDVSFLLNKTQTVTLRYNGAGSGSTANFSLYLDGKKVSTNAPLGFLGLSQNNYLGTANAGSRGIDDWNGYIGDVLIYNRALSPTEIKQLYLNPSAPFQKKTTTVVSVPVAPPTTTAKAVVLKKPKPSYATGYAKNASESANPNLWKGLVGAWMPSFGVTGETLRDVSGNGNDGTLTNMDAASDWVGTSKGLALDFDGVNDYVDCGTSRSTRVVEAISITGWVKKQTNKSLNQMIISGWRHPGNFRVCFILSFWRLDGRLQFFHRNQFGQTDQVFSSVSIPNNKWTHIATTSDEKTVRHYINGQLAGSGTQNYQRYADTSYNSGIHIGELPIGNEYLQGSVGCLSLYNRALSPSEIKQLYLNPAAPFERKQQTVGISTAQAFNPYWGNQATQLAGTLQ